MPYMLNGETLVVDEEPRVQDGTMFVPLRGLASALGGNADWEPTTGTAILYLNDQIATFQDGQDSVSLNGSQIPLQAPVFAEDGRVWVPVRFFEKVLGYTLSADSQNGIVDLSS